MNEPLYREELLDHFRHPRNRGDLAGADSAGEALNHSCGDQVSVQIGVEKAHLSAVMFQGKGCVISQAAASLLTEYAQGKSFKEVNAFTKDTMLLLIGLELGPTRLRCALLALEALQQAVADYKESHA